MGKPGILHVSLMQASLDAYLSMEIEYQERELKDINKKDSPMRSTYT